MHPRPSFYYGVFDKAYPHLIFWLMHNDIQIQLLPSIHLGAARRTTLLSSSNKFLTAAYYRTCASVKGSMRYFTTPPGPKSGGPSVSHCSCAGIVSPFHHLIAWLRLGTSAYRLSKATRRASRFTYMVRSPVLVAQPSPLHFHIFSKISLAHAQHTSSQYHKRALSCACSFIWEWSRQLIRQCNAGCLEILSLTLTIDKKQFG